MGTLNLFDDRPDIREKGICFFDSKQFHLGSLFEVVLILLVYR
jgi:hypothetical protein